MAYQTAWCWAKDFDFEVYMRIRTRQHGNARGQNDPDKFVR